MRFLPIVLAAGAVALTPLAHGARHADQLRLRQVASGFDSPVYVASTPTEPGRLYVVEQAGRIRVLVNGRMRATPFLDIRRLVKSGGEQGLLSMAFDPDYAHNHRFYVDYTDLNGDTRVVRYRTNGVRALNAGRKQLLFVAQPYDNHNGGQLQFGPDGLLYVGMGDGGSAGDPQNRAQNLRSRLGKLLRLDVSKPGARWQIAGYGLRNPWRFTFDRATGDLYIADVGQGSWEEVDYRPKAKLPTIANYGWSVYEGRSQYDTSRSRVGNGELVWPVAVYSHGSGCSVTGGYVYRGSAVAAARGRYFYGDYCSGRIWSFRISNGKAVGRREEPLNVSGLSSFGEGTGGELYAVSLAGKLYRLAG
ncbi:MAG: PQQ-dependent sugar dehydrogenase [Gaiellaceae bacterium]